MGKREEPLFTMEEICRRNGVVYDTSTPSESLIIRFRNGKGFEFIGGDDSSEVFKRLFPYPDDSCGEGEDSGSRRLD